MPVGAIYSSLVFAGYEAQTASCTVSYFPEVKHPVLGSDHPPPPTSDVKERVELYLYSLSASSWPAIG